MALKVQPALIEEYVLSEADRIEGIPEDEEPTKVSIRLASQGDVERRSAVMDRFQRQYDGEKVTVTQTFYYDEVERTEVELTLAACNIQDENGKALFHFVNNRVSDHNQFVQAWNKLPPHYAAAIKDAVKKKNAQWGPLGEG